MPRPILRSALAVIGGAAALFIVVVGVSVYAPADSGCGNVALTEVSAPDLQHKAVVFQRDCGATTGLSTQVSILDSAAALTSDVGNTFVADTNHGGAPSGEGGGPHVTVRWHESGSLVVAHHPAARVFKAERQVESIHVTYEPLAQ